MLTSSLNATVPMLQMIGFVPEQLPFVDETETKATADELKTNKLVFLHTDLGHNDVLEKRKEFCLFLKTSCLAKIEAR